MENKQINGRYSGVYFGANYFNHVYEPTEETTRHLTCNFKHMFLPNNNVLYRLPHKITQSGKIDFVAYSTEKNGGGTIKVYKINNRWIGENAIKCVIF